VFSYTKYDALNRIIEVGEGVAGLTPVFIDNPLFNSYYPIQNYLSEYTSDLSVAANDPNFPAVPTVSPTDPTYKNMARPIDHVTKTLYDVPDPILPITVGFTQSYLRNRVSSISLDENADGTIEASTYYSYDIHGNVNSVLQNNANLSHYFPTQGYKRMDYSFDLISGNMNQVDYQAGKYDQFHHRYYYDRDNHLTNVYTSSDGVIWDQDAKYFYYLNSTMARKELGDDKVQGVDYFYTINGWMKGVNANTLNADADLGKDGSTNVNTQYNSVNGIHQNIARDAFGFTLGYYGGGNSTGGDYYAINSNITTSVLSNVNTAVPNSYDLYNGNIKDMAVALMQNSSTNGALPGYLPLMKRQFQYDQLNRIVSASAYVTGSGFSSSPLTSYGAVTPGLTDASTNDFSETFSYDPNGNILSLTRNSNTVSGTNVMDNLTYNYQLNSANGSYTSSNMVASNQLSYVANSSNTTLPDAVKNQSYSGSTNNTGNYRYDLIGELQSDASNEIDTIYWNVYGKIDSVRRVLGSKLSDLEFHYDPNGNRICKIVKPRTGTGNRETQDNWQYTYYVYDVRGNMMATYAMSMVKSGDNFSGPTSKWIDLTMTKGSHSIYGTGRLGERSYSKNVIVGMASGSKAENLLATNRLYVNAQVGVDQRWILTGLQDASLSVEQQASISNFFRPKGERTYELENHLGNVQATISDKKLSIPSLVNARLVDYYLADVTSSTDYYAFGSEMRARTSPSQYRYGFNGKEKDDEVFNLPSTSYDFGARMYNSRLGRWMSADPKQYRYPDLSPYNFVANDPIIATDPSGETIFIHYTDEAGMSQSIEYRPGIGYLGNNAYVKNAFASLDEAALNGDRKLLLKLADDKNVKLNIKTTTSASHFANDEAEDNFKKTRELNIYWNQDDAFTPLDKWGEDEEDFTISPGRGLAHEVFHAYHYAYGRLGFRLRLSVKGSYGNIETGQRETTFLGNIFNTLRVHDNLEEFKTVKQENNLYRNSNPRYSHWAVPAKSGEVKTEDKNYDDPNDPNREPNYRPPTDEEKQNQQGQS